MATRQGGKYRREKGSTTRIVEPAREQRYGAHAKHPSESPRKAASSAKKAAKSTPVKDTDHADATT